MRHDSATPATVTLGSAAGRRIVAAAVMGSGAVFVESTVVNVALPAMGQALGLGMTGLQWIANGYLVPLSALLLLGGALGDAWGQRRVFQVGLVAFSGSSLICAAAPTFEWLVAARVVQGAAGALLVPTSLAYLNASFPPAERSRAIGHWAAWSAVWTAGGPLVGGLLVDLGSWRWIFVAASPLPLVALAVSRRDRRAPSAHRGRPVDAVGGGLASLGLGALVWGLLTASERGFDLGSLLVGGAGLGLLAAFLWHEGRTPAPLLPPGLFVSRQFAGANGATLLLYAALGTLFFLLMVQLQAVMGYTALSAGASLLPVNLAMLLLSPLAGRWAGRRGPRPPIVVGAGLAAVGFVLFSGVDPEARYLTGVLPGVVVFGCGLGLLVAPITSAVLASVHEGQAGVASGINNATARLAALLATAVVPVGVGLGGLDDLTGPAFVQGFSRAMWVSAGLCVLAGGVAWATIRSVPPGPALPHPAATHGCVESGMEPSA